MGLPGFSQPRVLLSSAPCPYLTALPTGGTQNAVDCGCALERAVSPNKMKGCFQRGGVGRGSTCVRQQNPLGSGWRDFHGAGQENPRAARPRGSFSRITALLGPHPTLLPTKVQAKGTPRHRDVNTLQKNEAPLPRKVSLVLNGEQEEKLSLGPQTAGPIRKQRARPRPSLERLKAPLIVTDLAPVRPNGGWAWHPHPSFSSPPAPRFSLFR